MYVQTPTDLLALQLDDSYPFLYHTGATPPWAVHGRTSTTWVWLIHMIDELRPLSISSLACVIMGAEPSIGFDFKRASHRPRTHARALRAYKLLGPETIRSELLPS